MFNLEKIKFSILTQVFLSKLKSFFLLCLLAAHAFAISDGGDFLVIPSAKVLGNKVFQARGTYGYHKTVCSDDQTMCDRHPFAGSARFGYANLIDFGVQFGSTISLDIKDQIILGHGYVPDIALGARAFVQSPEAFFYTVPKSERNEQTGEFYAAFGWDSELWNILGGVSAFPSMNSDAVAPFWGIEQKIGSKFGILYEGFFRRGSSRHNAGFAIRPIKALQVDFGATEFHRFFFTNDGDFEFKFKNKGAETGYRAPGFYVSIAINGFPSEEQQGHRPDLYRHEELIATQNKELASLRMRVTELEKLYSDKAYNDSVAEIRNEFNEIVKGYFETDLNLDSLRAMEKFFMEKDSDSKNFALYESQNKNADANNRITAIRMMSHFPDSAFIEPLGLIIVDPSNNEIIAREAALALGLINTPEAIKMLSAIVNLTSGALRKTIIDIIGEL